MGTRLLAVSLALALVPASCGRPSPDIDMLAAVRAGDATRVRDLVAQGADVNAADTEGVTPLVVAAVRGDASIARLLLDAGARVDDGGNVLGLTPLHAVVRSRNVEVADLLLSRGAPVAARDREGLTPLALAARDGASGLVSLLIERGGPLEAADLRGSTPLLMAALSGHDTIVAALVAAGADVNARNELGNTPWTVAVREGHQAIAAALAEAGARAEAVERPALEGDYLGQPRPGSTPARFAPGVVSTEKPELNAVFTPDGHEFYFAVNRGPMAWTIMVMRRDGNRWEGPGVASFSGAYSDVDLFITADGTRLYYCSNRPASGTGDAKADFDIWLVDRDGGGWSEPRRLDAPVNSDANEFYPSLTREGVLYFQSMRPGGEGPDLYRAQPAGDGFSDVERIGPPVNGPGFESDPFIAPDGSFLVFSRVDPAGHTRGDLFVTRRVADGAWSTPETLGAAVNTDGHENCPMLSPDGRYLFFTRDGDIYWVDAGILASSREP